MQIDNGRDAFEEGVQRQNARDLLNELLGKDVVTSLQQRSDAWGAWALVSCWGLIALAMGVIVLAQSLSPLLGWPLIAFAIAVIAGRQLAMLILMHEASHRSLFNNAWANDVLVDWLCAYPLLMHTAKYRKHHAKHHVYTGTPDDVDLPLVKGFPTTQRSLVRKLTRDVSGQTGVKNAFGLILMNAGILQWSVAGVATRLSNEERSMQDFIRSAFAELWPTLVCNGILFWIVSALGHPELFLAWLVAYFFVYPLFLRVRSIAEHAATELTPDMLKNTRTTQAGLLARLFVAPYNVNYHIEHHILVNAPYWQLPRLHRLLREKQVVPVPPTYWDVLKIAASK